MKNNRRNYYRILQVQPDASLAVIKNNYRTLLHKLCLHPDLGGETLTASNINLAYATLRDSVKRVSYDKKLFNEYTIEVLSRGHLAQDGSIAEKFADKAVWQSDNRRNYYRVLHVQSDASPVVIKASYKILVKKQIVPADLVLEAFSMLSIPHKREQYDQLLKIDNHINSILEIDCNEKVLSQSLIKFYCNFCKTPQNQNVFAYIDGFCVECSSPLDAKPYQMMPRRFFSRSKITTYLAFYTSWPGNKVCAELLDLSPTGGLFSTGQYLHATQVIKMDSEQFKAIATVKHIKRKGSVYWVGVEFLTIKFEVQRGTFMSTSV